MNIRSTAFRRVLRAYDPVTDELKIELLLDDWNRDDEMYFREAIGLLPNDPGYDCYPVEDVLWDWLKSRFRNVDPMSIERDEIFIEAESEPAVDV